MLKELGALFGIRGKREYCSIARWPNTMPQYHVGHKRRVDRIEACLSRMPNLELAGNAYHGVGIPDCSHSGELTAERILGVGTGNVRPRRTAA